MQSNPEVVQTSYVYAVNLYMFVLLNQNCFCISNSALFVYVCTCVVCVCVQEQIFIACVDGCVLASCDVRVCTWFAWNDFQTNSSSVLSLRAVSCLRCCSFAVQGATGAPRAPPTPRGRSRGPEGTTDPQGKIQGPRGHYRPPGDDPGEPHCAHPPDPGPWVATDQILI